MEAEKEPESEADTVTDPTSSADKNQNDSPRTESAPEAAEDDDEREKTLVIDDKAQETDGARNDEEKETNNPGKDILNPSTSGADKLVDDVQPQGSSETTETNITRSNEEVSSSSSAEVSTVNSSSIVVTPSSAGEHVKTPVAAFPGSKRGRKPKAVQDSSMLDENDLEHLRKPFKHGWKREIVYRNTVDPSSKRSACDVYYFPPSGKKLRSMVDIATYLDAQRNSPVNLTHFTFKRAPLFEPPDEIVRSAGARKGVPKETSGTPDLQKSKAKKQVGSKSEPPTKRKIASSSATSLSTTPRPFASSVNGNTSTLSVSATTASQLYRNVYNTPVSRDASTSAQSFRMVQQVPMSAKSSHGWTMRITDPVSRSLQKRTRPRPRTPDWEPSSASDDSDDSTVQENNVEIIKESACSGPRDAENEDEDDVQRVLGTPSKLIASILRPEPQKRPLSDVSDVDDPTGKRIRTLAISSAPLIPGIQIAPRPSLIGANIHPQNLRILTSMPGAVPVVTSFCSTKCPGNLGEPKLQCVQCKSLFHPQCVGHNVLYGGKTLCKACLGMKSTRVVILPASSGSSQPLALQSLLPLSSASSSQPQILIPISSAAFTRGGGMMTAVAGLVTPSSSSASKSLFTTAMPSLSASLRQPISSVNSFNIPPPPPLASYSLLTPASSVPRAQGSTIPPPPQLQPANIPSIRKPPPLHRPGLVPAPSQPLIGAPQVVSLPQPPVLQPCPSLISSRPIISTLSLHSNGSSTNVTESDGIVNIANTKTLQHANMASTTVNGKTVTTTVTSQSSSVLKPAFGNKTGRPAQKPCTDDIDVSSDNEVECIPSDDETETCASVNLDETDDDLPVSFASSSELSNTTSANSDKHTETQGTLRTVQAKLGNMLRGKRKADLPPSTSDVPAVSGEMQGSVQSSSQNPCSSSSNMQSNLPQTAITVSQNVYNELSKDLVPQSFAENGEMLAGQGQSTKTTSITQNVQILTLPLSIAAKINLRLPMALKINSAEFIIQPTCVVKTEDSLKFLLPCGTFKLPSDPSSKLSVAISNDLSLVSAKKLAEFNGTMDVPVKDPKVLRREFLHSFRILQSSFNVMVKIFGYLSLPDLLRVRRVCKTWHKLAIQPCLWHYVDIKDVVVRDWDKAAKFFSKVGVKSLNLKSLVHHASIDYTQEIQMWEALKKFIPTIQGLEQLYFNYVPSAALNYITERMPHLIDISVEGFIDASSTSDGPGSSTAETEEAVTLAVEEIAKGSLTLKEAADFYRVSEEDLIHLTQKNVKLTEEEEKDVLLCCLRLSRMGFTVSLSTFMSRCQEMFARRYSSKSNVPISDVYCRDLYYRNAPMFRHEIDFTLSDLLRVRLEVHYSSLRKLYKSLGPRNALTASQILIFDLTTFSLGKMTQYTGKSDSVTVVSAMSACATFLPLMLIWPTTMASSNPDVINRTSKHGLPTSSLVFQYIRSVLGLVQKRPVVILCNGNSALLSEQLVSTCISDSVYFYCVQSDIAKFVFPSYHGGFLHMLKRQVTSLALSKEDFMERVEALLTFKKQFILLSTRLSVSATGVFPLNPKAPSQFQDVNVHLSINRANNAWTAAHALPSMMHPSYGLETKLAKDSKTSDNSIKGIPKLDEEEGMEMDKEEEEMEEESTHLHSFISPKTDSKRIDREQEDRGEFGKNQKTHKKAKERKKSSQPSVQRNNSRYECSSAQRAAYKILRRVKKHFLSPKMHSPKINIAHVQSENQNENTKSEKVIPLTDLVQEPEKVASTPVESSGQPHSKYSISEKNKEGKSVTRFDFVTSSEGQAEATSEEEEMIIDVWKQVEIYKQKQKEIEERKKIASVHLDEIIQDVITQSSIYYEERYAGDASGKRDESENVEAEKSRAEKSTTNFKQNRKEYEENNAPAEKVDESPLVLTATGNNSSAKDDAVEHDAEDNDDDDDDEVGSEGMETDKSSGEPISDHVQERISKKKKKKHYTNQSEMVEESFQMRKDVKKKRKRKKKSKSESEVEDSVEVEHQNADESSFRDRKPKKDRHRKKKKRKEKKKKKKSGAKHDESLTFSECSTSEALKPETASLLDDEKPSTSEIKEKSGEMESESGETRKLSQLRRVSLLDHDYTRKSMEDNPSQAAESGNVVGTEGSDVEDVEMTDNAAVAELVPQIDDLPSSEISDLKGDEMGVEGSEDMVEEVVTSDHKLDKEDEESKDSESDSDSSSSSSDGKNSSSSGSKSSSRSSSGSSDKDSSSSDSDDSSSDEEDNRKSSTSKNNNVRRRNEKEQHNAEDSDSSSSSESSKEDDDDDSGDSSSDSDTSKKGGSEEEEEEDEDDDSKCQMCMRASPPHSKDMIIDWVDCDGNCGRWFHVICILRSHSKANVKHYVCPSCRCKR